MDTVRNISNVFIEDVFPRFLRFNGEKRNRLRNVSDVSKDRYLGSGEKENEMVE